LLLYDTKAGHAGGRPLSKVIEDVVRSTTGSIYASGSGRKVAPSTYQEVILRHPSFRAQYNQIMLDRVNGPLSVANVQAFLTQAEAAISAALANDPFPTTDGSPADEFNRLRVWVAARDVNVRSQLTSNGPPSPRP